MRDPVGHDGGPTKRDRNARDDRGAVEAAAIGSPAVTVIGAVAALRGDLAWAERRPLHGDASS